MLESRYPVPRFTSPAGPPFHLRTSRMLNPNPTSRSGPALSITRRSAIGLGLAALLTPLRAFAQGLEHSPQVKHPAPRPGITASAVLDPKKVPKRSREAYEAAKAVPEVLDGLYCHCHCAEHRGMRSLLSCFETEMPLTCGICKGEARLAYRLSRQGKTLTEIRAAVDAAYG